MKDKGGRRQLADRRNCPQSGFFPERRAIRHRQSRADRRNKTGESLTFQRERRAVFYRSSEMAA